MRNRQQQFGAKGESLAIRHLKKNGYQILEQNYRNRLGEIDIIARENSTLVFVEVKSRKSTRYGSPKLAVTACKQRRISLVALAYLKSTGQTRSRARFDVVTVTAGRDAPRIEIIKNAFELAHE